MGNRTMELSGTAFERAVMRKVEAMFEDNRCSPSPSREIPIIGRVRWCEYDPRASHEDHAELIQLAAQALLAQKWFEGECPRWMPPLPLNELERGALYESADRRFAVVARYSAHLEQRHWEYEGAKPFLDFFLECKGG